MQSTAAVLTTPPVSRMISPSITPSWPYAVEASSASSPIATSCSSLSPLATKSSSSGAAVTDSAMATDTFLLTTRLSRGHSAAQLRLFLSTNDNLQFVGSSTVLVPCYLACSRLRSNPHES